MRHAIVWRFFMSEESGWCWQRLSTDGTVLAESLALYPDYAVCLAAASNEGYLHEASQDHMRAHGGGMRPRAYGAALG
jgi:hypothetical protein